MPKLPRLILIDGSAFIFRAYHSTPPLSRSDGMPIGAIHGFCNMLNRTHDKMQADYLAVIMDESSKTFRNELYREYKAHRPPPPDDLVPQFAPIKQAVSAMNIPMISKAGYEADDIIAYYARQADAQEIETLVVSSDKDLMQLIGERVAMYDAMKDRRIGVAEVEEKFGVPPEKLGDVLALMGDSADNIPGVPGIGPKIAAELIVAYGDLASLLDNAHEIKQKKRRENLIEFREQALLSRELVELCYEVPELPEIAEFMVKQPNIDDLLGFYQEYELESLYSKAARKWDDGEVADFTERHSKKQAEKIADAEKQKQLHDSVVAEDYQLIDSKEQLEYVIEMIRKAGKVAVDTETDSIHAIDARLVGISLAYRAGCGFYIPVGHKGRHDVLSSGQGELSGDLLASGEQQNQQLEQEAAQIKQLDIDYVLEMLRPVFADPAILKIGQNIKYDLLVLRKYDVAIEPIADTMLLSYVTAGGEHNHNLDDLSDIYLEHQTMKFKDALAEIDDDVKKQLKQEKIAPDFSYVPLAVATKYAAEDADLTFRLYEKLYVQLLAKRKAVVYERIERPLIRVLVDMEECGVRVDLAMLRELSDRFAKQLVELEQVIYQLAGEEFNIGSPKQLGEILFDKMSLAKGKVNKKSGSYQTGVQVLEELAVAGHEIAEYILDWRAISKLKSTYSDALPKAISARTGRIHSSFAMSATTTGRLSSSDPNLQNIPIRSENGRAIRTAFIAREGYQLMSADYSQIELRILAHIAGINVLQEAFRNHQDIHAITASQIFGVDVAQVDADLRRKAKTINFGIIYGISAHGLAVRLGIERAVAANYIDSYFAQYPGIEKYMEEMKQKAREQGYVETLFGRRIHTPNIEHKSWSIRQFAERAAINAPIQGSAADIIKIAMVRIADEIRQKGMQSRMLLQVHDELIFEVAAGEEELLPKLVVAMMQGAAEPMVDLSVPLEVDWRIGDNWGEIH